MAGQYGLPLAGIARSQYVTVGGTSSASAALSPNTNVVSLFATSKCWVIFGTNPTATKPSAEKTVSDSFPVQAEQQIDVIVPLGTDAAPIKIAVIQDTTAGQLDIIERRI